MATKPAGPALEIEIIEGVKPLNDQFGVEVRKTVPDALHETLFGQPALTANDFDKAGTTPTVLGPMQTYALLDAAKLPYLLTELLDSSELRYQSLFEGKAQEEMESQAPYLVQLDDPNEFARKLFTNGDGVSGLWQLELGIFVRSRKSFTFVRKHLRKFTRVQIEADNTWNYFRFWEPKMIPYFLRGTDAANLEALLGFDLELQVFDHKDAWLRMYLTGKPIGTPPARIVIKNRDKEAFRHYSRRHYLFNLRDWLFNSFGNPAKIEDPDSFLEREVSAVHKVYCTDDRRIIAHCTAASWLLGESALTTKCVKTVGLLTNAQGAKKLYDRAYKYRYMLED